MDKTLEVEDTLTFNLIKQKLDLEQIQYNLLIHDSARTCEEAAKIRGVALSSGAKSMLIVKKSTNSEIKRENFILVVMSAEKQFSWGLLRKSLNSKWIGFASPEQVKEITNCLPGAVPPFGSIFGLNTITDQSLIDQGSVINFTAGLRTHSMRISVNDYIKLENPTISKFTE